ncbi:MAG: T9SS type A sorting domain-containing protein [Bacteroidales bacterium]|nr:T9SS type A sorting domain-containing protein [Bacteroidales bacterium]
MNLFTFKNFKVLSFCFLLFCISFNLNAQIVYTDLDPDVVMEVQASRASAYQNDYEYFRLDINDDGTNDMEFYLNIGTEYEYDYIRFTYSFEVKKIGNLNLIFSIDRYNSGTIIDQSSFSPYTTTYYFYAIGGGEWWTNDPDWYIAFRFEKDGNYHYGWMQIQLDNMPENSELIKINRSIIKDFAYNATPGQYIIVGDANPIPSPTEAVASVSILDIDDNGDGRDLEVSFPKIEDETRISEYRIMVVKLADSYSFELENADTVTNYFSVSPSGRNNYMNILTENSKDVNGEKITTNVNYKVFVLSVANGTSTNINALSQPSNALKLVGGDSFVNDLLSSKLEVYPNPTNSSINIKFEERIENIELYDVTGKIIFTDKVNADNYIINNVSNFPRGIYNLLIHTEKAKVAKRIVVQ